MSSAARHHRALRGRLEIGHGEHRAAEPEVDRRVADRRRGHEVGEVGRARELRALVVDAAHERGRSVDAPERGAADRADVERSAGVPSARPRLGAARRGGDGGEARRAIEPARARRRRGDRRGARRSGRARARGPASRYASEPRAPSTPSGPTVAPPVTTIARRRAHREADREGVERGEHQHRVGPAEAERVGDRRADRGRARRRDVRERAAGIDLFEADRRREHAALDRHHRDRRLDRAGRVCASSRSILSMVFLGLADDQAQVGGELGDRARTADVVPAIRVNRGGNQLDEGISSTVQLRT